MKPIQPDVQVTDEMVVDALVSGMCFPDRELVRSCRLALWALAPIAVPRMRAAAQKEVVSAGDLARLNQALQIMQDFPIEGDVNKVVAEALVKAFRVRSKPLNRLAKQAMPWCGPPIVDELVDVALVNIRKPTVCIRLLRAAFECGIRPTGMTCMNLCMGLAMTKSAAIHKELLQLFSGFGPYVETLDGCSNMEEADLSTNTAAHLLGGVEAPHQFLGVER